MKNAGFEVVLRDSVVIGETYEEYYHFVESENPDLIMFEVATPSIYNDLKIRCCCLFRRYSMEKNLRLFPTLSIEVWMESARQKESVSCRCLSFLGRTETHCL